MIKKKRITKSLLTTLIIILINIANINKINASWDQVVPFDGVPQTPNVTVTPDGDTGNNNPIDGLGVGGSCYKSSCQIYRSFGGGSKVHIDMYDMYGQEIKGLLPGEEAYEAPPILAGTYIGLNIYEEKNYWSTASYSYSAQKKVYTCAPYVWNFCAYTGCDDNEYGCCGAWVEGPTYTQDCGCGGGAVIKSIDWKPYGGNAGACAAQAVPYSINMSSESSYDIVYKDSNDIDTKSKSNDRYNTISSNTQGECKTENGIRSNSMECEFEYNREKVCINVKTGQVAYVGSNDECLEDEYEVSQGTSEDGKTYWKYFIPLNTNSKNGFPIILASKGSHPGILCKNLIDKYSDYNDRIVALDYSELSTNSKIAKEEVAKGCRYKIEIDIPVKQRFYNELENGINFNGFNFYYKPIDINNPFPNGINETSLWYEWNKNKKDPDLTKSYNKVTYVAQINDVNQIREYTKDNPYTNWYTMYVNGTSTYIENGGVITRYVNRDSYYPLGCGPSNENEYTDASKKVKNVFYQKECSK